MVEWFLSSKVKNKDGAGKVRIFLRVSAGLRGIWVGDLGAETGEEICAKVDCEQPE